MAIHLSILAWEILWTVEPGMLQSTGLQRIRHDWAYIRWTALDIQSTKTRSGADCGSDHELFITKFRLKLKKTGKAAGPIRYELNQIPYDYTVEVRNRFKGLDLIECLMDYGMRFVTLHRRQGSRPSPWKTNAKKQHGCLGRPYK